MKEDAGLFPEPRKAFVINLSGHSGLCLETRERPDHIITAFVVFLN